MMNKKILLFILLAGVLVFPSQAMGVLPAELKKALDGINNAALGIGVGLVVIGFVVAGIMYLASGGSTEKMGLAKKAFSAALIGAVIVIIASGAGVLVKIISEILGVTVPAP